MFGYVSNFNINNFQLDIQMNYKFNFITITFQKLLFTLIIL